MTRVTRRYAFSAAHVLARPDWGDDQNRAVYGKCANPSGHGHNYVLEVTVVGEVDPASGRVVAVERMDSVVHERVLVRLDQRFLNHDVVEFETEVPTAENIARFAWHALKGEFAPVVLDRVRLVEITYEDIEDDYDTRTKIGFLIESDEQMAARLGADLQEVNQFHPAGVDGDQAVIVSMFQYLIGNSDWSPSFLHNVKLIRHEGGRFLTVPYDFDFSGAVNARYAGPPEAYPIRRVTDRYFHSYCRPELEFEPLSTFFNGKKAEIIALYEGFETLREDRREDVLDFYEDFWEMMDDERRFERQISRNCQTW